MVGTAGTGQAAALPADTQDEDFLRAQQYRFLARWLAAPPDRALLDLTAQLSGDGSELGQALSELAAVAAETDPAAADDEFHDLFVGIGRGELVPHASYYLTGFLNEKPLATLRQHLASLGIARAEGNRTPEDHISALCDVMAGLITGEFGEVSTARAPGVAATAKGPEPVSLGPQNAFFNAHLAPWAGRFFADLERAKAARVYRGIGAVGRIFMEIEEAAFEMTA